MLKKIFFGVIVLLFLISCISAEHYITGYVNNSLDDDTPNNKIIYLWHTGNSSDNLTDIIGVNGNSGSSNTYSFDCELLDDSCNESDNLSVQIIDSGKKYSHVYTVNVTNDTTNYVDTFRMNSNPYLDLLLPFNDSVVAEEVLFKCFYNDSDRDSLNVSLYSNKSGSFDYLYSTTGVEGNLSHSENFSDGNYAYYCSAEDDLIRTTTDYNFFEVDSTNPIISDFSVNQSFFCGDGYVRLSCSVSEENLDYVYFEINSPLNYFEINASGTYYLDFYVNESGEYSSRCVAVDDVGNIGESNFLNFSRLDGLPDLDVQEINFSEGSFSEGEGVNASVFVNNSGCVNSGNFNLSFYKGSVSSENLLDFQTISLEDFAGGYFNFNFTSLIGRTEYFFVADNEEDVEELNESNNQNSSFFEINSWQTFYGGVTAIKYLADSGNNSLRGWGIETDFSGNIFVADLESDVSWADLLAIGKTTSGGDSSSDFSEIDSLLGTSDYSDSVFNEYSSPSYLNYTFNKRNVTNVPSVSSTSGDPFYTGILWDSSDDSNGEFDSSEKEDLVFISEIERGSDCGGKSCDYEIQIPAKLREYSVSEDSQKVYLYYDLK